MRIRRMFTMTDEVSYSNDRKSERPLRKVAAIAVVQNPFAGKGFIKDLSELTDCSEEIGTQLGQMALAKLAPYEVESYGKGAIIGLDGDQEHGVAMLTTLYGNAMRAALGGGIAWISSMTKKAAPGTPIDIPLAHKNALYVRSHYDGMTLMLPGVPNGNEIAIICCVANRGRLDDRVGGPRASDIQGKDGLY